MSGVVAWLTGLPASGKTTLARALLEATKREGHAACLLDSDEVRRRLVPAHGYDEDGRRDFYTTLGGLAAMLAEQGLVVLVAATAHRRSYRDAARALAPAFVEIHVATTLEECRRRDPKGLYARAASDGATTLPGLGVGYEAPESPDVVAMGEAGDLAACLTAIRRSLAQSSASESPSKNRSKST
ncbi:MAG: adenylyl-sulfate kinase [Myxococcales bacterium]|nr:adenylyl-sulfate kinase [Myxococcales bacterium]